MSITRFLLPACALVALAFCGTAHAVPSLTANATSLGGGLYGYTISANPGDAQNGSMFVDVTFTRTGGSVIQHKSSIDGDLGDGVSLIEDGCVFFNDKLFFDTKFGGPGGPNFGDLVQPRDGLVQFNDKLFFDTKFGQCITPQDVDSNGNNISIASPPRNFLGATAQNGVGTYDMARDSYFFEPWTNPAVQEEVITITRSANTYGLRGGTGGGSHINAPITLAYIVADGALSFNGVIGRAGADTSVSGTFNIPPAPGSVVPEPSSVVLLGLGALAGVGLVVRRRRVSK